jgi:hypothetical protein
VYPKACSVEKGKCEGFINRYWQDVVRAASSKADCGYVGVAEGVVFVLSRKRKGGVKANVGILIVIA